VFPLDLGQDDVLLDAVRVLLNVVQHATQEHVGEQMRKQAEVDQLLVSRIVIMLLRFNARILQMVNFHHKVGPFAARFDQLGQLQNVENFRKLVENSVFTRPGIIENRQLYAAKRVSDIKKASQLTATAVDRERNSGDGLDAEPIEHCPEQFVVMEAGGEARIERRLVRFDSVHYTLVQVG